jgi:hypothetical protein
MTSLRAQDGRRFAGAVWATRYPLSFSALSSAGSMTDLGREKCTISYSLLARVPAARPEVAAEITIPRELRQSSRAGEDAKPAFAEFTAISTASTRSRRSNTRNIRMSNCDEFWWSWRQPGLTERIPMQPCLPRQRIRSSANPAAIFDRKWAASGLYRPHFAARRHAIHYTRIGRHGSR